MEQLFQCPVSTRSESTLEDVEKWKSSSAGAASPENNSSGGFDCNICLDFVQDPVVTFCGHLYCWPCIYKWIINSQRASSSEDYDQHQPQCPVCKADVSENTLIPLYGRGQPRNSFDGKGNGGVPQRPRCGVHTLIASTTTNSHHPTQQFHHRQGYPDRHQQVVHPYYSLGEYPSSPPAFGFAGTTTFHPMIGMFGEMIHARIFGNSQTTLYTTYPNTYSVATTSSARVRRHVMQADRSLSRVSFFLCCCIIVCLLLF